MRSWRLLPALALLLLLLPRAAGSPSWSARAPTPAQGGYGQALVGAGDRLYVVRCASATGPVQLWRYDPSADSWESLSAGLAAGTFRNGTALAWDGGDFIYALGGARYEDADRRVFLRYRISTGAWESLPDTPGPQGAGDALAWSAPDNRLYALMGSSRHGAVFACYDPSSGTWSTRAPPPASQGAPGRAGN